MHFYDEVYAMRHSTILEISFVFFIVSLLTYICNITYITTSSRPTAVIII